jgi:hypothetical protein
LASLVTAVFFAAGRAADLGVGLVTVFVLAALAATFLVGTDFPAVALDFAFDADVAMIPRLGNESIKSPAATTAARRPAPSSARRYAGSDG